MNIVFVDFDHTISKKDSFIHFILFAKGFTMVTICFILFAPFILLYFLKLYPGDKLKIKLLKQLFKRESKNNLYSIGKLYSEQEIHKIINLSMLERLTSFKNNNHKIVVVSASLNIWLRPWCQTNGFDLISTKLSFDHNNVFSGKYDGHNCKGIQKVILIKKKYNLSNYEEIITIGNKDDMEMLSLASSNKNRIIV